MVKITETILRDAHQSLIATRMRLEDMLDALEDLDDVGYHSLEVWGGATFDSCLRFLNEDPWERLRIIRKHVKKTKLQMLLRGQNLVGYRHYADDVLEKFIELAAKNGIDIFRIFDALNDMRNIGKAIEKAKTTGKEVQGCISYTISPVHTEDKYLSFAKELKSAGCDSLAIKDMAGLLDPAAAKSLVSRLKKEVELPVQVHTHCTSGLAMMTYYAAAQAGADVLDCALSPLSWGTSQPPTESIVYALRGTELDTKIDPSKFAPITSHFKKVREKYSALINPISERLDVDVLAYQIPGGMLSNLVSQLEKQKKLDKYDEVLAEVPVCRAELGYPPLVTPTSQIVGTQAVMNVIAGERYKMVTKETKDLVRGMYGTTPAKISDEFRKRIIGDDPIVTSRPADNLEPELPQVQKTYSDLITKPEDAVSLALYQEVAAKFLRGEAVAEEIPSKEISTKQPESSGSSNPGSGSYDVTVNGRVFHVDVVPAGSSSSVTSIQSSISTPSTGKTVPSPLQGTVFKILKKQGDTVKSGETIIILEAMKMENEISSPYDGTIGAILVNEGQSVESDTPLATIN
ncbi:MAG: sodium-extruding oxaloacetate decarboxylase subunit alpha [Deltaproteobacteria bacterium]|nr:sodium-extruding oxaloacetate decarboxylase subunit alpha [Deltaproteobacteria bacterium]